MRRFPKHIVVVGRLLVVLFVLANSGFTAVLHQCAMGGEQSAQSNQTIECCSTSSENSRSACEVPQATPSSSIVNQFTCHTNTVVGGLAGTSALLEKESKTQLSKLGEWSGNLAQEIVFKPIINHSFTLAHFAINTSPPSVEKCVLNSSFLI
jgi:hypothetical protein